MFSSAPKLGEKPLQFFRTFKKPQGRFREGVTNSTPLGLVSISYVMFSSRGAFRGAGPRGWEALLGRSSWNPPALPFGTSAGTSAVVLEPCTCPQHLSPS